MTEEERIKCIIDTTEKLLAAIKTGTVLSVIEEDPAVVEQDLKEMRNIWPGSDELTDEELVQRVILSTWVGMVLEL